MARIVIIGNSGSGKSTLAARLAAENALRHLDLDTLAWDAPGLRRPLPESLALIHRFLESNSAWVIEGCYSSLLEAVLPFASDLRFLNPGVETCVQNCRSRPWEPHKYASKEEQDRYLDFLLAWVREYETRTDEFSLVAHRQLFESFEGLKREYTAPRA